MVKMLAKREKSTNLLLYQTFSNPEDEKKHFEEITSDYASSEGEEVHLPTLFSPRLKPKTLSNQINKPVRKGSLSPRMNTDVEVDINDIMMKQKYANLSSVRRSSTPIPKSIPLSPLSMRRGSKFKPSMNGLDEKKTTTFQSPVKISSLLTDLALNTDCNTDNDKETCQGKRYTPKPPTYQKKRANSLIRQIHDKGYNDECDVSKRRNTSPAILSILPNQKYPSNGKSNANSRKYKVETRDNTDKKEDEEERKPLVVLPSSVPSEFSKLFDVDFNGIETTTNIELDIKIPTADMQDEWSSIEQELEDENDKEEESHEKREASSSFREYLLQSSLEKSTETEISSDSRETRRVSFSEDITDDCNSANEINEHDFDKPDKKYDEPSINSTDFALTKNELLKEILFMHENNVENECLGDNINKMNSTLNEIDNNCEQKHHKATQNEKNNQYSGHERVQLKQSIVGGRGSILKSSCKNISPNHSQHKGLTIVDNHIQTKEKSPLLARRSSNHKVQPNSTALTKRRGSNIASKGKTQQRDSNDSPRRFPFGIDKELIASSPKQQRKKWTHNDNEECKSDSKKAHVEIDRTVTLLQRSHQLAKTMASYKTPDMDIGITIEKTSLEKEENSRLAETKENHETLASQPRMDQIDDGHYEAANKVCDSYVVRKKDLRT